MKDDIIFYFSFILSNAGKFRESCREARAIGVAAGLRLLRAPLPAFRTLKMRLCSLHFLLSKMRDYTTDEKRWVVICRVKLKNKV